MLAVPRLLYTSFDEVPAPKGASTHIDVFARALAERYGQVLLVTPGPWDLPAHEVAPGLLHRVLGCPDDNPLGRARSFRVKLMTLLQQQRFDVLHFRSIFEGYWLAREKHRLGSRLLYEVNGFPSIEMKYLYRNLSADDSLPSKLANQEYTCLHAADQIITISEVTRQCIHDRGVAAEKIHVIPNGVDPQVFWYQDAPALGQGPLRLLYVGTLTVWQGIETLLEAVALVGQHRPVSLWLIGPAPRARRRALEQRISRLNIQDAVRFLGPYPQAVLRRFLHCSHAAIVPLLPVDRNTQQGCCPLKMLEAMAAGCPVIAADLPVIRELVVPEVHFLPMQAGHAGSLQQAILHLAAEPCLGQRVARQARQHVTTGFTWEHARQRLYAVYDRLLGKAASMAPRRVASAASE